MTTRGDAARPARCVALLAWMLLLVGAGPAAWIQGESPGGAAPAQDDVEARILGVLAPHGLPDDEAIQLRLATLREEFAAIPAEDPRRTSTQRAINRERSVLENYLELEAQWAAQRELTPTVTAENLLAAERNRDAAIARDRQSLIDEQVDALRGINDLDELRARVLEVGTQPLEKTTADRARFSKELEVYRQELLELPVEIADAREELALTEGDVGQWLQKLTPDSDPEEEALLRRQIATGNLAATGLAARSAYLAEREPFLGKLVPLREAELSETEAILELRRGVKEAVEAYLQAILTAAERDARESVEQKKRELERAEYPFDRSLKEQEVRSHEIEEETAIFRSALQDVTQRGATTTEELDAANLAKIQLETRTSRPDDEAAFEADVLAEILRLQSDVDWPQFQKVAQGIEEEVEATRGARSEAERELSSLDEDLEARIEVARLDHAETFSDLAPAEIAARWSDERAHWDEIRSELHEQLALKQRVIDETLGLLVRLGRKHERLRDARLDTIRLLRRSNLFLRGRSLISVRAIRKGFRDLSEIPAYSIGLARQMVGYFAEPAHSRSILACLGLLLLAGIVLVILERAVAHRLIAWTQADGEERQDRTARSAIYLGRGVVRSISIFLLFLLPAKILPSLPVGVGALLIRLGITFAALMVARRITRELLKYDARKLLRLTPDDAARLYFASTFLIYLSLAYWPPHLALEYLGYENRGALDFAQVAYSVLVGLTLLTLLVRRSVFLGMLPESRIGRVLRLVTTLLHPFVVLLVPGLLILYALNYEILASLITSVSVGLVLVSLVGFLVYHGALFMAGRAFRIGMQDPEEDSESRRSRLTSFALTRFLLRFGTLLAGFWVLLVVNGARLGDLRFFFNVPIPIQTDADPASAVTYWDVLVAVFVFILTLRIARHLKATLQDLILPKTSLDTGLQYTITTLVGYIVIALGISLAVSRVFDLDKLGYVVAALSIGIGFGLQEIISNFISGLILLFERPLKVGDLIEVGGTEGIVRRIQIRSTTVQTRDNVWILVPNKDFITQNVTNLIYDDSKLRIRVRVGVAYGSDTALVRKVLLEVAKDNGKVLKRPIPEVWFEDFGDSALIFDLLCWVADPIDRKRIASFLRFAIDAAFRRCEITIPFPQRDLHLRSVDIPVPLRMDARPAEDDPAKGTEPVESAETGARKGPFGGPKG